MSEFKRFGEYAQILVEETETLKYNGSGKEVVDDLGRKAKKVVQTSVLLDVSKCPRADDLTLKSHVRLLLEIVAETGKLCSGARKGVISVLAIDLGCSSNFYDGNKDESLCAFERSYGAQCSLDGRKAVGGVDFKHEPKRFPVFVSVSASDPFSETEEVEDADGAYCPPEEWGGMC